ncbi:MAG: tRNA pseudouridine(55) synthase TruB [Acidobacteriota bacterium]|nr:tRNA pseudouridine(55) synthase TruB [Acidobacteriota bacterium]MDQ7087948.1 tRNA pseudouridine(55) synthase TruB [Acidobacteriota bacterium]
MKQGTPCGLLLIDKTAGMTSHDVVRRVRRNLGLRRVGHAGTLDPFATGLLPCLVGPATRLVRFLHGWPKTYTGRIRLGEETDTLDLEGTVTERRDPPLQPPPWKVLRELSRTLSGTYRQTPPAYSAKKIGGTRAHRLARQGHAPVLQAIEITVHRLRLQASAPAELLFAARVSSGTYIRSLARDLGRRLGTLGHLTVLRRTAIGPLSVRQAVTTDVTREDMRAALIPLSAIPLPLPTIELPDAGARDFCHGRAIQAPHPIPPAVEQHLRAVDSLHRLLGVARVEKDGWIRPEVVLGQGLADPDSGC